MRTCALMHIGRSGWPAQTAIKSDICVGPMPSFRGAGRRGRPYTRCVKNCQGCTTQGVFDLCCRADKAQAIVPHTMALRIAKRAERHGYTMLRILRTVPRGLSQVTYSVVTPDGRVPLFNTREQAEAFIDEAVKSSGLEQIQLQA